MSVELNHTIVHAKDGRSSARFLADILGVEPGPKWGPFYPVHVDHGMTLDYIDDPGSFTAQHYAFLVSDDVFDAARRRIEAGGITIWADPHQDEPGRINEHDGGRGFYFEDPDRHLMELITVPYGGWPTT